MQIRVYYEDTDAMGMVYFANYLKFCERARSEVFFLNNFTPHNDNGGFVVFSIEAKFLKSAKLGDLLEIKTTVEDVKKISLTLTQNIYKNGIIIFQSNIKLGYIKNNRLAKIDEDIKNILKGELC